jgi:hypothetical protein
VKIADQTVQLGLSYVAAVSRQGHAMTVEDFQAFITAPRRRTTGTLYEQLARVSTVAAASFGGRTEDVLSYLTRLRWIVVDSGHVGITALGRAVLAALDEADRVDDLPAEIVLEPTDQLSYARVIGVIAEAGRCALVDAYFSIESLLDIVQRTQVERILIHPERGRGGRVEALQQAITDLRVTRPLEIRASDSFHDRFIIPAEGPVRFLGTSLNGVGRRLAITGRLSDEGPSDAIRQTFERTWSDAEPIVQAELDAGPSSTGQPVVEDSGTSDGEAAA